ncbi:hypothetical protein NERG_02637 [Nematocida ausubeli]|uniref:Uncharacterized protein n=1 Tax=Nematocida ausubeli (strain ATCC PRA-371 / ERTm2) TaxID=1913371 RepID=H8ZGB6_NEMA1|nr:hypothetical protein NERG_02637 [Nematocida ausubeli]
MRASLAQCVIPLWRGILYILSCSYCLPSVPADSGLCMLFMAPSFIEVGMSEHVRSFLASIDSTYRYNMPAQRMDSSTMLIEYCSTMPSANFSVHSLYFIFGSNTYLLEDHFYFYINTLFFSYTHIYSSLLAGHLVNCPV